MKLPWSMGDRVRIDPSETVEEIPVAVVMRGCRRCGTAYVPSLSEVVPVKAVQQWRCPACGSDEYTELQGLSIRVGLKIVHYP